MDRSASAALTAAHAPLKAEMGRDCNGEGGRGIDSAVPRARCALYVVNGMYLAVEVFRHRSIYDADLVAYPCASDATAPRRTTVQPAVRERTSAMRCITSSATSCVQR